MAFIDSQFVLLLILDATTVKLLFSKLYTQNMQNFTQKHKLF